MSLAEAAAVTSIDVDGWRRRIREETLSHYHYEMGVALAKNGDIDAAAAALRRALAIMPHFTAASVRLARLSVGEEAENVRAAALRLDPGFASRGARDIAFRELEYDNIPAARLEIDVGLAESPNDPALICCRHYCDAVERLSPAPLILERPQGCDDDSAEALSRLYVFFGLRLLEGEQWADARISFEAAIRFSPAAATAYERLALLDAEGGDLATAETRLQTALELDGENVTRLELLGDVLMRQGRPAEAEQLYRRLSLLNGGSAYTWGRLGGAALAAGKPQEAAQWLRKALDLAPDNLEAMVNLALAQLPAGQANEAVDLLRAVVRMLPDIGSNYVHLGAALLMSGHVAEARQAFSCARSRMSGAAWPVAWIGLTHLAEGDAVAALRVAEEAAMLEPTSVWALSVRALALHAAGRIADAVEAHRAALTLAGADAWSAAWIRGNQAATLEASGEVIAACEGARDAFTVAPLWSLYQQSIRPPWAREAVVRLYDGA